MTFILVYLQESIDIVATVGNELMHVYDQINGKTFFLRLKKKRFSEKMLFLLSLPFLKID